MVTGLIVLGVLVAVAIPVTIATLYSPSSSNAIVSRLNRRITNFA